MTEGTQVAANIATVVGAIAAIAAALGGIGVLLLTNRQLGLNTEELARNAAAQTAAFWLQLREMFAAHDEVHRALIQASGYVNYDPENRGRIADGAWWDPMGQLKKLDKCGDKYEVSWAKDAISQDVDGHRFDEEFPGPKSPEDWRKVEAYLGLFEHCESMLRKELIDQQTFKEIYQYRLVNLMANRKIVIAKLGCNREGWQRFIDLLHMVGIEAPPEQNLKTEELCTDKFTSSSAPRFGE